MYRQPMYGRGGGFFGSTFGQAIATGAGFAIGEDIIDDIFFQLTDEYRPMDS